MNATNEMTAVKVDEENNADTWWSEMDEIYPHLAASLRQNGAAVISRKVWSDLEILDGWDDGPCYARLPLIDCGSEGDQWGDVVSGRHGVFAVAE